MINKPGYSWGPDDHINLMRSSRGWLAVYYDHDQDRGEIIKIFDPRNMVEYHAMMLKLAFYNYNTCVLCPLVKAEIDATC